MSKGLAFWIVYLVALVLTAWFSWPYSSSHVGTLVVFVLVGLLGWEVFGAAIRE